MDLPSIDAIFLQKNLRILQGQRITDAGLGFTKGDKMVTVNGEQKDIAGSNLYTFLKEEGYELSRVVIELNLDIIPKEELENITIKDEDVIEVLRFVGGG